MCFHDDFISDKMFWKKIIGFIAIKSLRQAFELSDLVRALIWLNLFNAGLNAFILLPSPR